MRSLITTAACLAVCLTACGKSGTATAPAQPAPTATAANAPQPTGTAAEDQSPEALEAKAAKLEAEANRLVAQANAAPGAGATAPSVPATPAAAAPAFPVPAGAQAGTLGPTDEKLHSGQFYKAISIAAQPGETFTVRYDAQGYQPAIIVLGPDNKPDSQSMGPRPDASGRAHVENETTANRGGTWHVLLSAAQPGATGSFTVWAGKVTSHTLR